MLSERFLEANLNRLYKYRQTIIIHLSIIIAWVISIWLMYVLLPNQLATRIRVSRVIFIGICIQLLILAFQQRRYLFQTIREFFTGTTHPINLAIFRIVLFSIIFQFGVPKIVWFSQLPKELLFPPVGSEWLISFIPINATVVQITGWLLKICSFTAMIGLFTRTSAWLTVILGVYVLGIPQFYGKVDHYHHILWFAAILAASRCADVLSLDAIFMSWKRADRGQVEPPSLSRVYALPLRFVWLLLGILYFFPGFWKLWHSGFDWAFSDNLKYQLYAKWLELDGWMPLFRLDRYPVLYKLSAFGSILFELTFILLIIWPATRYIAAIGGLILHNSISLIMNISFLSLQKCYVAFFDWNAIFHWIGCRLFPEDMYVLYDGNCKLCRRTIATFRVFDIFGRLTFINALDEQAIATHNLFWLDSQALLADMHVVRKTDSWKAFYAYRVLAMRIPIFWPILPLLYVWPVPQIGKRIYRSVADSRTCSLPQKEIRDSSKPKYRTRTYLQPVMIVGFSLLLCNIFFGLAKITNGWPFACYPRFSSLSGPQTTIFEVVPISTTGEPVSFDKKDLKGEFAPHKFAGLTGKILNNTESPIEQKQQLNALWQVMTRSSSNHLQEVKSVQFYQTKVWNDPERRLEKPVKRSLISELNLEISKN